LRHHARNGFANQAERNQRQRYQEGQELDHHFVSFDERQNPARLAFFQNVFVDENFVGKGCVFFGGMKSG